MAAKCDSCGRRRVLEMHPVGMDLCRECVAWADEIRDGRVE